MTIWAAIPVKPIAEGKSRLAGTLSPAARKQLNGILFQRTLDAVAAVIPANNIIVVTRDPALRELAQSRQMQAIAEQGNELNAALDEAALFAGQDALLAISTDLPALMPEDVQAMLGEQLSIAPDRARRGTNALFMPSTGRIPFCFGENSFAAHLQQAARAGLVPQVISRPGLAFDLDLPEDLSLCPPSWSD